MCFATIDTDAIGSCRLPASCCGVAGYKCTWGRIDNSGILAGEKADDVILKLATVGIMAREVADIASVVDCLTGSSVAGPFNNETAKPSIGIVTNYAASPDIRAAFEAAVAGFKEAGHLTQEATVPFTERPDMKNIERYRQSANDELFGSVDVLILPTTAGEVLTAKAAGKNPQALSAQNTFFVNYYGLPAISVPCGFDANGLPVGLQIVGRQNQDDVVLQVAQAYQSVTRWHSMHPQR
jgi:aspartyl-tRNA(Asn)/glutamyl-tRNA(Gln) amidotransferase subunit A